MRLRAYACASRSVTQSGCSAGKARRHMRSRGEIERERDGGLKTPKVSTGRFRGGLCGIVLWHHVILC